MLKMVTCILLLVKFSFAHFGVLIAKDDLVTKEVNLKGAFAHPFAQDIISKEPPAKLSVLENGKQIDLLSKIKMNPTGIYELNYPIKSSGDYVFVSENKPYFEKDENKYITHITKVIINASKRESNWNQENKLQAEIVPLVRPYGLKQGMLFSAQVLQDSKPVANAEVEIELYNEAGIKEEFEGFKVTTDSNGIFNFVSPYKGWVGFSALLEGQKIEQKDSEIGAVLWIKFR